MNFVHALRKGQRHSNYLEVLEKTVTMIVSSSIYKDWLKKEKQKSHNGFGEFNWRMDKLWEKKTKERIKRRRLNKKRWDAKNYIKRRNGYGRQTTSWNT